MKKISVGTYRKDTLYPKVVKAVACLLKTSDEISPVAVLIQMGNLEPKDHDAWCRGQVPYLERVFKGSLSKANRILRIIGFHTHDLHMVPKQQVYKQSGRKNILLFSKAGDSNIEKAYSCHFKWNKSQDKKQELIKNTSAENKNRISPESNGESAQD